MADNWGALVLVFLAGLAVGYLLTKSTSTARTYNNLEEWEFLKDDEGRTLGVRVKRTARAH